MKKLIFYIGLVLTHIIFLLVLNAIIPAILYVFYGIEDFIPSIILGTHTYFSYFIVCGISGYYLLGVEI